MSRNNRLPNFAEYLAYASVHESPKKKGLPTWLGFLIGAGALAAFYAPVSKALALFPTILMTFCVGLPIVGMVIAGIDYALRRPRTQVEQEEANRHKIIGDLLDRAQNKKLYRQMDPTAAQLLEASAYYWSKIHKTLAGPAWTRTDISGHYATLRDHSIQAADQAMLEATMLCAPCVGEPQRKKSSDLANALEDLFDLDWEDALEGFRRVAKSESSDYAHRSPHIGQVFQPTRDIAERLKLLSEEVERVSSEMLLSKTSDSSFGSVSSIDLVLHELQMARQAEAELERRLQQGQ